MNYQNSLLNKKGRFGAIWLAAHHPAQVNRRDIIRMNLHEKCKDIVKYILNGRSKVPRFSLLISSHLMFGLVVLIDKQYKYLYDELKEFNLEMKSTYTLLSPVKQRGGETPSKKGRQQIPGEEETIVKSAKKGRAVDKRLLTLKENLPEMMDKDASFDSLVQIEMLRLETAFQQNLDELKRPHGKNITMTDIFDERVSLIPVEQPIGDDDFGQQDGQPILTDEQMIMGLLNIGDLEQTVVPKPPPTTPSMEEDMSIARRGVMRDISNQELTRPSSRKKVSIVDQTTVIGELEDLLDTGVKSKLQKTTIAEEESLLAEPMMDTGLGMPELYQDTFAAPQPTSPVERAQTLATIEEAEAEAVAAPVAAPVQAPVPVIETEEPQIEEQPVVSRKKTTSRKRPFIFDETTMIPESDFKKRMSREELKKEHERNLARVKPLLMKTCYDYAFLNPFMAPSVQFARRVNHVYSKAEYARSVNCQVIGSLVPRKQEDDQIFYCRMAIARREQMEARDRTQGAEQPTMDTTSLTHEQTSEMEIKRLTDSKTGSLISKEPSLKAAAGELISLRDGAAIRRSKLKTHDTLPPTIESRDEGEQSDVRRRLSFEDTMVPVQEMPSEFMMQTEPAEVTVSAAAESVDKPSPVPSEFEQIVLEYVRVANENNTTPTFQHLISISKQTPKRMFVVKSFSALLNLCAKKSLNAQQKKFYGVIKLTLP